MNHKLLSILVCPNCQSKLIYKPDELICKPEGLAFAIENDIPVMLIEQARKLSLDEVDALD